MHSLPLRLALIFLAAFTTSCGIELNAPIETHYVNPHLLTQPPERMGTVVGSIGLLRKATNLQRYTLLARNVATGQQVEFFYADQSSFRYKPDFIDNGADVQLFTTPLPEGRYEIWNYEYSFVPLLRFMEPRRRPEQDFSLPFEIKAGQATYLGQFIAVPSLGKPVLGMPNILAYYWEISDRRTRDIAQARLKLPEAKFDIVTSAIPDPTAAGIKHFVKAGGTPPDWPIGPAE